MQLVVFNGEIFKRGWFWYLVMGGLFIFLVVATLFSSTILGTNTTWIPERTDVVSALLFLSLFIGYWFYVRKEIEKPLVVSIDKKRGLWIGDVCYQWHAVQGFSLEVWQDTGKVHNIIFLVNKEHKIHTISDTPENIEKFVEALAKYTPFIDKWPQPGLTKILRKLKI